MELILASSSPRRRVLLGRRGLRFRVQPAQVEEWHDPDADPQQLVLHNARLKGQSVAREHPGAPVLAADSAVAIDGLILHKPVDLTDAEGMLRRLSGRTHTVYTGVCLIFRERGIEEELCVTTDVTFKRLRATDIGRYFKVVDPLDKAGAYGIQEHGEFVVERIEGSPTNVMGLPMETTVELLETFALLGPLTIT